MLQYIIVLCDIHGHVCVQNVRRCIDYIVVQYRYFVDIASYTHSHTHIHTHTHIYTHIHTYIHILSLSLSLPLPHSVCGAVMVSLSPSGLDHSDDSKKKFNFGALYALGGAGL